MSSFATSPNRLGSRSRWRQALGFAVSVLLVALVVRWALRQGTPHFPDNAIDLLFLVVALAVYAGGTVVRGWRWHEILKKGGVEHKAIDAYALTTVNYMGSAVLPARAGEVLRIVLMAERSTGRKRDILGSVVSERVLDVVALVLLLIGVTLLGIAHNPVGDAPAIVAGCGLLVGAALAGGYLFIRLRGGFQGLADRIRPVTRPSRMLLGAFGAVMVAVTMGIWLSEGVVLMFVVKSLGVHVSLVESFFVVILCSAATMVPAAPGFAGTFDAALAFGLRAVGVTGSAVVSVVLLERFVVFVPITIVGLGFVIGRYGGLKNMRALLQRPRGDAEPAAPPPRERVRGAARSADELQPVRSGR
jgi:glycosyltransferase 2 family protein